MDRVIINYHNNLSSLHLELTIELVQPFLKKCPIHPCFLLRLISAREVTNVIETYWTERFSNYAAIPVNHTLLCFPPEQRLDGSASQRRPYSSAFKIFFSWYLANIVGNVVSSQRAVIPLVTFCEFPETSLKVMPCQKKRRKML